MVGIEDKFVTIKKSDISYAMDRLNEALEILSEDVLDESQLEEASFMIRRAKNSIMSYHCDL